MQITISISKIITYDIEVLDNFDFEKDGYNLIAEVDDDYTPSTEDWDYAEITDEYGTTLCSV